MILLKMKRLISIIILILIASFPITASAQGDFDYEILADGTAAITSYKGSSASVEIPSSINGSKVTEIGSGAFAGNSSLKSVTIPDTVTKIGSSAFAVCESLTSVSVPNTVSYIDSDAFYLTPWITNYPNDLVIVGNGILLKYKGSSQSVDLPNTVNVIGYGAFSDSPQIKSVNIPNTVRRIDGMAFAWTDLEQITIPASVTKIGDMAFQRCTKLTSVTIPSTVTEIGTDAFFYSPNVTVKCRKNSAAEKYCIDNNIRYESSDGEDAPPYSGIMGDVDGDGEITANDALTILRASVGLTQLTDKQFTLADIDGDNNITANDALSVLRISAGAE